MSQPNSFDDEPMMFEETADDQSLDAEPMEPVKPVSYTHLTLPTILLV